jgi:hypothetical protein
LADLQVYRTADRYVVLVARQLTYRQGMAHMYPVQNVVQRNAPVVEGRAYGFDRRSGKPIWTVKNFGPTSTLVKQPAHLPLMVFAMNIDLFDPKWHNGETGCVFAETITITDTGARRMHSFSTDFQRLPV